MPAVAFDLVWQDGNARKLVLFRRRLNPDGLRRDEIGLRRAQLVAIVLVVQARERVTRLHGGANIDQPRYHLAGDAEAKLALVARAHLANGAAVVLDRLWMGHDRADGSHFGLFRGNLAAGSQGERKPEYQQSRSQGHWSSPWFGVPSV